MKPVMRVRQFSRDRDRDRGSIDEVEGRGGEVRRGETAENQDEGRQGRSRMFEAEARPSENHVNILN